MCRRQLAVRGAASGATPPCISSGGVRRHTRSAGSPGGTTVGAGSLGSTGRWQRWPCCAGRARE
eukprot:781361-Pyramimonas_sp.AAC.1